MNELAPLGSPERDYQVARLTSDTGYFCRFVLGMDTDRDSHGNAFTEIGKGGIRDFGPHQEVVSFIDDESSKHRLLWAPRAAYKSSIIRGYIMRRLIAHPNISILVYYDTDEVAKRRLLEIREELETNKIIRELCPEIRGRLWKQNQFITALRTDKSSDSPSLFAGSPRKMPVGTRPNEIIWDDIVTENDLGEVSLARGIRCVERSLPLGAAGCRCTFVGTPKHYADAGHWILEIPGWKKLVHLDSGLELKVSDDRTLKLEGTGRWPHLTRERLTNELTSKGVSLSTFMSEYQLRVVSDMHQAFQRTHFQPVSWVDGMRDMTGYLLTDVAQGTPPGATSKETRSTALNVLMYVGIAQNNDVVILDLECGRWQMSEFCERYVKMIDRWAGRVNHRGEVWEQVHSNTAYAQFLAMQARTTGRKPTIFWQQRNSSALGKDERIRSTCVRFQAKQVYVCSTVPRQWVNDTEVRSLWSPDGYVDPKTGVKLPAGDMVEQFIRHPYHPLKDIPDAFSLVDSMDKETRQRVCFWTKPSSFRLPESELRQSVQQSGARAGSSSRFYERLRRRR